jgi:flagellar biosynthesis/type III secretory pathway M-ring protein FliF/YscJ
VTNKTATASASLVAAVPAGVLGFFLIKTFLTGLGQLPTTFIGIYGVTLAACAAVVFLPFAVLIFGAKSPARQPAADQTKKTEEPKKGAEKEEPSLEESFEEPASEVEADAVEEALEKPTSTGEFEIVEPTASDDELGAFDGFDDSEPEMGSSGSDDEFRFDDEEEEEPPKKKKKK